ncbi:hypothetical protein G7043_39905 [Lentzea sp. NEAU-D13]|uniref:Uncharacterized protein n=1 Tax=Lentzea alba TaxID=2714351 RepID=A0A7C9VY45_9PSEU|nr:hypothetical protein [Lentzea alba]NGY65095.1 hypothetical protein [Lentzea alba]
MLIVLGAWVVFVIGTAVTAAGVALFQSDSQRRKDALQVLRTVLGAGTALGVTAGVAIKLHEAGLV